MFYSFFADLVLIVHMTFIVFVVFGGILVFKWTKLIWLHIPCVVWGILIEIQGWICPLTPLENYLRNSAGTDVYKGSFIQHYLIPVIYPSGLTAEIQIFLGVCILVINVMIYYNLWRLWDDRKQ